MLAALLLGPWAGTLVMTAVLVVQALLFQDGGITALGANVLNMGVLPCLLGFLVFRLLRRLLAGTRGALISAFVTAWLMVVLGASLAAVQLALSGTVPLRLVLPAMAGIHALIGIGEGLITAAALAFLLRVRRDLVHPLCRPLHRGRRRRASRMKQTRWIWIGLAVALAVGALLSLAASAAPDGLERVAEDQGFLETAVGAPLLQLAAARLPVPRHRRPKAGHGAGRLPGHPGPVCPGLRGGLGPAPAAQAWSIATSTSWPGGPARCTGWRPASRRPGPWG